MPDATDPPRPRLLTLRRAAAVVAVVLAALGGALGALAVFAQDKTLAVGTVRLSVEPFHEGALDVYVPVVDWGARFPAVDMPARLTVDVRAIDRDAVQRLAAGGELDVAHVRGEARDAIAAFLRTLLAVMFAAGALAGILVALAVRHHSAPRLRWTAGAAVAAALIATVATALTLPPREPIDRPQYYAFGPDIPRALEALETVRRSERNLDQELNSQLVGIARLVVAPAGRQPVEQARRLTLASDLHNNGLVLSVLERAARGGPVFFAGDLTDRGTPLETAIIRRITRTGDPFVFVTGNHDSDALARQLAADGAIVLTREGRMDSRGRTDGRPVQRIAGLRVAGYDDPFVRLARDDYRDTYEEDPGPQRRAEFAAWAREVIAAGAQAILVHEPQLIADALAELDADPPQRPVVFLVGHTHRPALERRGAVTVLNGGSMGAGGTGNLTDRATTPVGLAVLAYDPRGGFEPLAADLVEIDPATGAATARRARLDDE